MDRLYAASDYNEMMLTLPQHLTLKSDTRRKAHEGGSSRVWGSVGAAESLAQQTSVLRHQLVLDPTTPGTRLTITWPRTHPNETHPNGDNCMQNAKA